jgi:hypothetical protein
VDCEDSSVGVGFEGVEDGGFIEGVCDEGGIVAESVGDIAFGLGIGVIPTWGDWVGEVVNVGVDVRFGFEVGAGVGVEIGGVSV